MLKFSTGIANLAVVFVMSFLLSEASLANPSCQVVYKSHRIGHTAQNKKFEAPVKADFLSYWEQGTPESTKMTWAAEGGFYHHDLAGKVMDRLMDRSAWFNYVTHLQRDTRENMLNSGIPGLVNLAKAGGLNRNAMLKVLVQRAKARGEMRFYSTNSGGTAKFLKILSEGPFFDRYFAKGPDSTHGQDAHLIQRDFVSDIVRDSLGSNSQSFYEALSKDSTIWNDLFDADINNPTSPEYVTTELEVYLPLK